MKKLVEDKTEEIDTSHIVADIFQLNRDIITAYDNYPKKIGFFLEKRKRKKLIKESAKLAKANVPLGVPNVYEFMTHIYNNYSKFIGESKKYSGVSDIRVTTIDNYNQWKILLEIDNTLSCDITINTNNMKKMNLVIIGQNENGITNTYTVNATKLHTSNSQFRSYCERINHHLLEIISNYVIDTLELYNEKE